MICSFFSLIARVRPRRRLIRFHALFNVFVYFVFNIHLYKYLFTDFFIIISTRLFVVLRIEMAIASAESNRTINVHVDRKRHLVSPNVPRL